MTNAAAAMTTSAPRWARHTGHADDSGVCGPRQSRHAVKIGLFSLRRFGYILRIGILRRRFWQFQFQRQRFERAGRQASRR